MFRLDGKRALITGGTSGIGEATARIFLQAGARVVISARAKTRGPDAADTLRGSGEIHFLQADISREEDVRRLVEEAVRTLGGLDVVVNNAGIIDRTPLESLERPQWEEILATDLTGVYLCSRYVLPHVKASRGSIVNVASYLGFRGGTGHTVAYNAAKAGVVALTRSMAVAYGPNGIRVNAVCPGFVPTELNRSLWEAYSDEEWERLRRSYPLRRTGTPEDVAYAILFLASDESGWITGASLFVDGGLTAK